MANVTTPIIIDLDSGFVVSDLLNAIPAMDLGRVKRSATQKFAVQFVKSGADSNGCTTKVLQELSAGATGIMGFKLKGQRNSSSYAAAALSWVKTGSGTSTVYTFTLTFSSSVIDTAMAAIDAALESAGQSSISTLPSSISLEGEVKWTDSDGDHKTLAALKLTVESDIVRGGEVYQAPTPAQIPPYLKTITRQTGSTSTDLDAVPILQFAEGDMIITRIGGFSAYSVDAGAADGSDGGQVTAPDSIAFHYTRRI